MTFQKFDDTFVFAYVFIDIFILNFILYKTKKTTAEKFYIT